jgi:hypothetical protein
VTDPITWWLDRRAKRRAMRTLADQIEHLREQMAYCDRQYFAATGKHIRDIEDPPASCRADWTLTPCPGQATTTREGLPLCEACAGEVDRVDVLRGYSLAAREEDQ